MASLLPSPASTNKSVKCIHCFKERAKIACSTCRIKLCLNCGSTKLPKFERLTLCPSCVHYFELIHQEPRNMSPFVVKLGMLRKKGSGYPFNWKYRLFCLDSARIITYFDCDKYGDTVDKEAKGSMPLLACTGLKIGLTHHLPNAFPSDADENTAFAICIHGRELLLVARSSAERNSWCDAIVKVALLCRHCYGALFPTVSDDDVVCTNVTMTKGYEGLYHSQCWAQTVAENKLQVAEEPEVIEAVARRIIMRLPIQELAEQTARDEAERNPSNSQSSCGVKSGDRDSVDMTSSIGSNSGGGSSSGGGNSSYGGSGSAGGGGGGGVGGGNGGGSGGGNNSGNPVSISYSSGGGVSITDKKSEDAAFVDALIEQIGIGVRAVAAGEGCGGGVGGSTHSAMSTASSSSSLALSTPLSVSAAGPRASNPLPCVDEWAVLEKSTGSANACGGSSDAGVPVVEIVGCVSSALPFSSPSSPTATTTTTTATTTATTTTELASSSTTETTTTEGCTTTSTDSTTSEPVVTDSQQQNTTSNITPDSLPTPTTTTPARIRTASVSRSYTMSGSAASTAAQTQIELHLTCNDVAFDFTCYRPALCAQVREHSGISEAEYLAAFAHAPGRANLLSGGRSGSIVARSHDGKVVFKTMKNEELVILLRILDVYVAHLATFPCSMLSRYLGLYRVKRGNTSFTFMAMANVLDRGVEIHEIYDLKGSSHGRQSFARTETRSGVGKDLDLNRRIRMEREAMSEIHSQISADVGFLHELQLMDYSMLLGVHVCDEAKCHHDFSEYENTLRSIYKRGAQGYGTDRERFIYVFGIIDLLQDWNLNKRMEQFVKTSLFGHSCESVSAVEPDTYAVRFKEALSTFLR